VESTTRKRKAGSAAGWRDADDRHDDRSTNGYESPAIAPRPSSCTRTPTIRPGA
jgi:hypothetical protein